MAGNQKIDKTNMGYLGSDYQYKLVKCFIEDPDFFQGIYSIIDQNTFTEPLLKQFVGTLKDYYKDNGCIPSYETMSIALKRRARMSSEIEEWDTVIKKLKSLSSEGDNLIIDNATRFFKQQNMVKVAKTILQITEDGDTDRYDDCIKMVEDAINVGKNDDDAFNPYDLLNEATSAEFKFPIPTGISKLDEQLNGGLEKKKLGVIIGSAGFGKTTFTTAIGSYASTCADVINDYEGFKVLQFIFEDDKVDIARKHFSRITQIEAKDLSKDQYTAEHVRELAETFRDKEMFRNNLHIIKLKTDKETVSGIKNKIKKEINKGFRPDLILIDYFECIAFERGYGKTMSKWDLQEVTMRSLERMAEEFNVALWVTTQGNKDSFVADVVRMDQGGGSVTKVQIGHVIISIARSTEDQANNIATLALLKNRQGGAGRVFKNIKFNNGTSTISCDDVEDFDTMLAYEMDLEEKKREEKDKKKFQPQIVNRDETEVGLPQNIVSNDGWNNEPKQQEYYDIDIEFNNIMDDVF